MREWKVVNEKLILKGYDSEEALSYLKSKSKYRRKMKSQQQIEISYILSVGTEEIKSCISNFGIYSCNFFFFNLSKRHTQ